MVRAARIKSNHRPPGEVAAATRGRVDLATALTAFGLGEALTAAALVVLGATLAAAALALAALAAAVVAARTAGSAAMLGALGVGWVVHDQPSSNRAQAEPVTALA